MKSLKFSDYIEIRKPTYVFIKITSHKSIRNFNSTQIAKMIALTYKTLNKKLYKEQKKFIIECNFKISYVIDIVENNANFYFIIPRLLKNQLLEKINEIWSKATVEEVEDPFVDVKQNFIYEVRTTKEDALSLTYDKKSNDPLNYILSTMDVMKSDDRVTMIANFMPRSQFGWIEEYNETMEKVKQNKSLEKATMTPAYILKMTLLGAISILDKVCEVLCDFTGSENDDKQSLYSAIVGVLEQQRELSTNTKNKKQSLIIPTQIAVCSNKEELCNSVSQSLKILDEDNEITYRLIKKKINILDWDFNISKNIFSVDEVSNLIKIPGRALLLQHRINHIKVEENSVPEQLKHGYISLGENTCRGNKINTFIEDHKEIGTLPLMLLGRQGGGKTTYLCNYTKYAQTRKESIIHIDFIRNNEASKSIEKIVPKDKCIILDFSKEYDIQSLAYNEISFSNNMTWFDKQQLANKKTQLTIELVNSINETGDPLSPKMERFLSATTDLVYLDENATFKDVVKCLQDFKYREKVINKVPNELREELEEEIETLKELDEWSKTSKDNPSEKIGTRDSKIEGILDRVTLLKRDFYLKKMFNKTPENNLDFVKAMEEGKVLLIRMPQSKFKSYVKNVITTFIITKCWLACELRGELSDRSKRSHIIIDEIAQTKTAERYMENILTQTRKFGMKFVLAGQYLDQLDKKTIYSLKGAGTSFMLLKGAIKEDYEYFKDELDGTYEYEDLKEMEEYSSLNIIQYSKGYSSFITKLPKPI